MNKYIVYIGLSIFLILLSSSCVLYAIWDVHQPKIGPVGDGPKYPSFIQMMPVYCGFLSGAFNLPVAIRRYLKYKNESQ